MKKYFYKLFSSQKTSAGFTLIELLVATSLTSIVVSLAGFGLVTIMGANNKAEAETQRRVTLNRALDFIADEVRMASSISTTAPTWASGWTLGGGSPSAKLYVQIPIKVENINASSITVSKHGFSGGNAVMFTGSGLAVAGLSANVVYYVTKDPTTDSFKVSTSISNAKDNIALSLSALGSESLTVNRLLIYYIRENTSTWLPPRTINRSAGPCSNPYEESNCPALVDSIADTNGFTASVTSSRQAELRLLGKISNNSTQTYEVSTKAFARSNL